MVIVYLRDNVLQETNKNVTVKGFPLLETLHTDTVCDFIRLGPLGACIWLLQVHYSVFFNLHIHLPFVLFLVV